MVGRDGNSSKGNWSYGFGNEKWHPAWNGEKIKVAEALVMLGLA